MCALNLGEAQNLAANGTFPINMGFAVPYPIFLQYKPSADSAEKTQKRAIFPLPRGKISRKATENRPNQQCRLNRKQNRTPQKEIYHCKNQYHPHRHTVKGITPVSSPPEAVKPLSEFHISHQLLLFETSPQKETDTAITVSVKIGLINRSRKREFFSALLSAGL